MGNGQGGNGVTLLLLRILLGSVMVMILAVGGWTATQTTNLYEQMRQHRAIDGHPVMVERVIGLKTDLVVLRTEFNGIKADIKEILKLVK